MRQKVTDLGLETWFHPTIDIQRNKEFLKSHIELLFRKEKEEKIIQKGDSITLRFWNYLHWSKYRLSTARLCFK